MYIWRLLLRLGECLDVARFLCSLLLDVILLADPWGACGAVRLSLFSLIVFWLLSGVLFSVCLYLRRLMSIVRRSALLLAFQVWAAWPTNTLSLLSYIIGSEYSLWTIVFLTGGVLCVSMDSHFSLFLISLFFSC